MPNDIDSSEALCNGSPCPDDAESGEAELVNRLKYVDSLHELATRTLLEAQAFAEDIRSKAEQEARANARGIIAQARDQAQAIIESAEEQAVALRKVAGNTLLESECSTSETTNRDRLSRSSVAPRKAAEDISDQIELLYQLAIRALLEAQSLAEEVIRKEREESDNYAQEIIAQAEAQAGSIVAAAEQQAAMLRESTSNTALTLLLCALGRHNWSGRSRKRTCIRCNQVEEFHRNIHGDEYWLLNSRDNSIRLVRWLSVGLFCGVFSVIVLMHLPLPMLSDQASRVSNAEIFEFSGEKWITKSDLYKVGPGPNYFSDQNVFVDEGGRLHLRIQDIEDKWTTAEAISSKSFGYGTYTVKFGSVPHKLGEGIVLGIFTWDDSPEQYHREIDIELRQILVDGEEYAGTYAVQPWDDPGHHHPIGVELFSGSTYVFKWSPDRVDFFVRDEEDRLIESWMFTGPDVPTTGNARLRINLWLVDGRAPTDLSPVEVVLESFSFQPLSVPNG